MIVGTWLIFLRETFVPWLYAKLLFVALLVVAHAAIGRILIEVAEKAGRHRPPEPYLLMASVLIPIIAILVLVLVLAKPDLTWVHFPEWLQKPVGDQLPFEVPRW